MSPMRTIKIVAFDSTKRRSLNDLIEYATRKKKRSTLDTTKENEEFDTLHNLN